MKHAGTLTFSFISFSKVNSYDLLLSMSLHSVLETEVKTFTLLENKSGLSSVINKTNDYI